MTIHDFDRKMNLFLARVFSRKCKHCNNGILNHQRSNNPILDKRGVYVCDKCKGITHYNEVNGFSNMRRVSSKDRLKNIKERKK